MKRVLVVEDDPDVKDLICRYLELRDFHCDGASSAAQCMAQLDSPERPDLILVDLELPDLDGAELTARIRERQNGDRIPVLMISGVKLASQIDRARQAGVDACLFKPFSPKELLAKVREMTEMKRQAI